MSAEEDEALKKDLEADGALNARDAAAILERARSNAEIVAAVEKAIDGVLTIGGGLLSLQIPGAAFAVAPAKAILEKLLDEAIARRLGQS